LDVPGWSSLNFGPIECLDSAEILRELIKFLRDQFSTIAMTEGATVAAPRPSSEVCKELSAFVAVQTDHPRMYLELSLDFDGQEQSLRYAIEEWIGRLALGKT
jgi:hypothetical protein